MRVAVTGSRGLIGSALVAHLDELGHDVTRVVRSTPGAGEIGWDPDAGRLDANALSGIDAVVHLAGAGIGDRRWSAEYKRTIHDSRTRGTNLISEAVAAVEDGPRVLLSASGVDYYGDRGDERLDETSAPGAGFLADVCRDWEASTAAAEASGARVVHMRTGPVLSPDGGALTKLLPLFKLGLGGRFGSGRQWFSWISISDHVAAMIHLLTSEVRGAANLTAPNPVTNAEFTKTLGAVLRRPTLLPVPRFGPALLAGREAAESLLYSSHRVYPAVLQADGFQFAHPDVELALRALLRR
jgi:uncharacterized protein (TIGR01777 family)